MEQPKPSSYRHLCLGLTLQPHVKVSLILIELITKRMQVSVCRIRVQQVMDCTLAIFTMSCLWMTYREKKPYQKTFLDSKQIQELLKCKGQNL